MRFTEGRNVEEYLRLLSTGRLDIGDLITHEVDIEDAPKAYEMITKNPDHEKYIGVLLKYSENESKWKNVVINTIKNKSQRRKGDVINLGLIGAGSFARSMMLPLMQQSGLYCFRGLATTGGVSTGQTNEMFPFEYTTNEYKKLLIDDRIDLIAISTQHNSHAKFVIEALNAGKNVYCEKPLCLKLDELKEIEEAYKKSNGELFCGLNRRHAPLIKKIRKELQTDKIPAVYIYTVNAGYISPDHWTHDVKKGGGRIIGEAIHFVDTIQYLDGSEIDELNITFANNIAYPMRDNAIITLKLKSGAVGTIIYTPMGSKKYPKENIQVFSNGSVYEMKNYVGLSKYKSGEKKEIKIKQDKGIYDEYIYIASVINEQQINKSILDAFDNHRYLLNAL